MTKADLIAKIAQAAGITKAQAGTALDATTEAIIASVKKGQSVGLVGFGTFKPAKRAARKGRNPKTGDVIKIPASKSCRFSVGKGFKDALNGTKKK